MLEITQIELHQINLEQGTVKITGNVKNKGRELHLKSNQVMLFYHYLNEIRPVILQTNKTQSNIFILSGAGKRIFPGIINRMINEGKSHMKNYYR
ncbi:MAG: hypothetical protein IPJ81_16510 [Chitinophagaceae bacterium]|nr:hypothetical protein [Chitinophagaceae bacterium]